MLDLFLILCPFTLVALLSTHLPRWCIQQGMVAEITERHAHDTPTPHGGGALLVAVVVPLALLAIYALGLPRADFLTVLLLGSLGVAGVSFYDDKFGLSAKWRLLAHLTAVAMSLCFLPQVFDNWPFWLDRIVVLLAWGWFVNLYNFMDGLDGLSTSNTVFLSLALAFLFPAFAPILLILAGACLGFLRVNWMPAKVFVGDVGSTFYGYLLGGLMLIIAVDDTWRLIYPMLTLALVFCADATYTLIKRIAQGHNPSQPHREFWIHRAATAGFAHAQVVEAVLALNALLFFVAAGGIWLNLGWLTLVLGGAIVGGAAYLFKQQEARMHLIKKMNRK